MKLYEDYEELQKMNINALAKIEASVNEPDYNSGGDRVERAAKPVKRGQSPL